MFNYFPHKLKSAINYNLSARILHRVSKHSSGWNCTTIKIVAWLYDLPLLVIFSQSGRARCFKSSKKVVSKTSARMTSPFNLPQAIISRRISRHWYLAKRLRVPAHVKHYRCSSLHAFNIFFTLFFHSRFCLSLKAIDGEEHDESDLALEQIHARKMNIQQKLERFHHHRQSMSFAKHAWFMNRNYMRNFHGI